MLRRHVRCLARRFFTYGTVKEDWSLDMSYVGFFIVLPIMLLIFWVSPSSLAATRSVIFR